jgi:hypothetical protein
MQLFYDVFSQQGKEALKKAEKDLCPDYVLTHYETQAVEQKEDEREEGEQGEKCKRGGQTGTPMAQKRSYKISEKTKGLHKARWVNGLSPT